MLSKVQTGYSIVAKVLLKLPNLVMLIRQKSLSFPRNLAHMNFDKLLIVFSTKSAISLSLL